MRCCSLKGSASLTSLTDCSAGPQQRPKDRGDILSPPVGGLESTREGSSDLTQYSTHTHTFCGRTYLILHVVFLSFQQREVKSQVVSFDKVLLGSICAQLDRDCQGSGLAFFCIPPSSEFYSVRPNPPCTSESTHPLSKNPSPLHPY